MIVKNIMIIAVEESDSSIGFYDPLKGEVARIQVGLWPHEIVVSGDGKTAFVTNFGLKDYDEHIGVPGASISVIDIENCCEVKRLFTYRTAEEYKKYKAPHGIKVSGNGRFLYVNVEGEDEEMLVYDLDDPQPFPKKNFRLDLQKDPGDSFHDHFDIREGTHNFILSEDGKFIFLSAGKYGLYKIDAQSGASIVQILEDADSPVRGLTYDHKMEFLIVSAKNVIYFVDPESFSVIRTIANLGVGQILYSQPTPDGKYILAPAVWESMILVIDIASGSVVRKIIAGIDPIHIAFDRTGEKAYASHGRSKYILEIDLKTLEITNTIQTKGGPNGIAIVDCPAFRQKGKLKFGACLPLSGVTSTEGREIRLGYQLWQERTNEAGGILINGEAFLIELVFRDTLSKSLAKGDEEYIRQLTEDLVLKDKVNFLLGSYPTPPNLYMAEVAHRLSIPMVTATGAGEKIFNNGYNFIYGIMSPARAYLSGTIEVILQEHRHNRPKSIFFLSCDDAAAGEDARSTAAYAVQNGLQLIDIPESDQCKKLEKGVYVYKHNSTSFDEMISLIKKGEPDLFFVTGHLAESVAILSSVISNKFEPKAFAFSVGPTIPSFRNRFGDQAKYIFGSAQWNEFTNLTGHDEMETPANFSKHFFVRFSMPVSYFSAGGYACGIVFKHALINAGTIDPLAVNQQLKQTSLQTFFADISFDHRGLNDSKPIITVQILDKGGQPNLEIPIFPKDLSGPNTGVYPFPGWDRAAEIL